MIPDEVVEEVRARADIVDVVGEFVPLKKAGKDYKAVCPFHEERTPSFYVVPSKGIYHCFGCQVSGDAFSFVMERLGLEFVDAVKWVAERVGVEIREVRRGDPRDDPHRILYEVNAFARDFYRERLWEWDGGKEARAYLEGREIDRETGERFSLGYAPDDWRSLREAAATHGMDDELLATVGLLNRSERSPEPYDRFRDRIVFPIESVGGKVLGFGGRVIGSGYRGAPKYLNSPETPIYHKGQVLYGLSWARHAIRREEAALVVEGYMDVVSLAAAGLEHVVAPLGTAMTEEQARLLERYCDRVLLLFDSDPAGLRATFRTGDILLGAGLHPAVVTLPPGEDPDTVVRSEGAERLRAYLDQAVDVLDRKLQILEERDYFSTIERTRDAVDRLLPTLRAAADPTLRDIYVSKVAARTGVRRETLEGELEREPPAARAAPAPGTRPPRGPGRGRFEMPGRLGAERMLLLLLLRDRRFIDRAAERVAPEDFRDAVYGRIFRALLQDPEMDAAPPDMDLVARHRLEDLLGDPEELAHSASVFEKSVARIRYEALQSRITLLRERIGAEAASERKAEILKELTRATEEARELGEQWRGAIRPRPDPDGTAPVPHQDRAARTIPNRERR